MKRDIRKLMSRSNKSDEAELFRAVVEDIAAQIHEMVDDNRFVVSSAFYDIRRHCRDLSSDWASGLEGLINFNKGWKPTIDEIRGVVVDMIERGIMDVVYNEQADRFGYRMNIERLRVAQ